MISASSWPSGKEVTAVTTDTQIQFAVGETIYKVWFFSKEIKSPF